MYLLYIFQLQIKYWLYIYYLRVRLVKFYIICIQFNILQHPVCACIDKIWKQLDYVNIVVSVGIKDGTHKE